MSISHPAHTLKMWEVKIEKKTGLSTSPINSTIKKTLQTVFIQPPKHSNEQYLANSGHLKNYALILFTHTEYVLYSKNAKVLLTYRYYLFERFCTYCFNLGLAVDIVCQYGWIWQTIH